MSGSGNDGKRQTFIPAAALKRFANELDREGSNKFLQINRERVNDFIEKGPVDINNAPKGLKATKKKLHIAGVNEYDTKPNELPTFLHLQSTAEFQPGLGSRSRFGEGDGSFFDQWLNSDVVKSKHIVDKDGLPVMKFCLTQTQTGFKRHMNDYKAGKVVDKNERISYVKSYAERREERLQSEKKKEDVSETVEIPVTSRTNYTANTYESYGTTRASTAVDLKLPAINTTLSATDRDNYFGEGARGTFFEYYRQLARQRYTVGGAHAKEGVMEEELDQMRSARQEELAEEQEERLLEDEPDEDIDQSQSQHHVQRIDGVRLRREAHTSKPVEVSYAKKKVGVLSGADDEIERAHHSAARDDGQDSGRVNSNYKTTQNSKPGSAIKSGSSERSALRSAEGNSNSSSGNNNNSNNSSVSFNNAPSGGAREEKALLWRHLAAMPPSQPSTAPNSPRPLSARSKFLIGCVRKDVLPQPGVIIRKEVTTTLDISSMGIGNGMAELLAESVDTLPLLEGLCIADNNLTDVGLVPIVNKLFKCAHLKSFDLSHNKVDAATADALQGYLSSPGCNLVQLIMRNANVDDNEAARFVLAIAVRNTLQELDLSQNILGSHEFAIRKEESTAGESLGHLLEDPLCSLRSLKLSWNMIRYQSGVALCRSLGANKTLTFLDVSYNGLGVEGGEALGNALHTNSSLVHLNVSHNNITARACFTLLCGVRSCQSLRDVDLSENPIGEEGARALLALNMIDGHRLTINIKGCSLRIKDPTCWFDSHTQIEREFALDLSRPYERAVCVELLRIVSQNEGLHINKFQFQGPEDSAATELNLTVHSLTLPAVDEETAQAAQSLAEAVSSFPTSPRSARSQQAFNHNSLLFDGSVIPSNSMLGFPGQMDKDQVQYEIASDIDAARELFHEKVSRLFSHFDMDESGSLDKHELLEVLKQMGMTGSRAMVDKIMAIYDTDGSGRVEEDEFINFLADMKVNYEKNQSVTAEKKYIYAADAAPEPGQEGKGTKGTAGDGSTQPDEFFPPSAGKVAVKVTGQRTVPDFVHAISQESVETMLNASKSLSDSGTLFECALSVMKLGYNEAKTFFRVMLKDSGNEQLVLLRLLPRMISAADARLMIAFVTNGDFLKTHNLKVLLGPMYRIYTGIPNGYYKLNLAEEQDRYCMQRLIELSNTYMGHRQRAGLGDTSQNGDWMGFRNVLLDGKPLTLTRELLDSALPEKGRIEFDFISLEKVNMKEAVISNLRLFRILFSMGLVEEDKRKRLFVKLKFTYDEGRAAAKGSGVKKWETAPKTATVVANKLHKLYHETRSATYSRKALEESAISKEELVFLDMKKNGVKFPHQGLQLEQSSPEPSPDRGLVAELSDANLIGANEPIEEKSMETFDTHIKLMLDSGMADPALIAARSMDVLETALSGRFLNCAQLALIVYKFPDGYELHNDYATYRVELIVRLFSRLVDLVNFDYVLKELDQVEYAMLVYRLGWLNVWNPLKAEGAIQLDLSRREERQLARMLVVMNYVESSHTWMEPYYRPPGVTALPDEHFSLPTSWYSESTLPAGGILSLTYFSGKGVGLLDCYPDLAVRMALMSLVLAQPYAEDHPVHGRPSLEAAEAVCEKTIGCKLSFKTEKQVQLKSTR